MLISNRNHGFTLRARAILAALAICFCLTLPSARAESDGMVRVKLARLGSNAQIGMVADCDYYLSSQPALRVPANTQMTLAVTGDSLTLSFSDQAFPLGKSATLMRSVSGAHGMRFTAPSLSNRFCGDLTFSTSSGVITTVLNIYIEDYLYGAVGYVIAPSSGLEALKAQAIVARNYALRQKSARSSAAFDLADTGDALTFRGFSAASEYADVLRAVDATKGQLLYYGDSPATCYYCDSNGGQTESAANATGASLPYSLVQDDPYDLKSAGAKKSCKIAKDASNLEPRLEDALVKGVAAQAAKLGFSQSPETIKISAIESVIVGEARFAAPSRLHKSLTFRVLAALAQGSDIRAVRADVSVPTYGALEDWYDLGINADDNETIYVSDSDKAFEITFRRNGHGVGMSQRGAQVMAKSGKSCEEILAYYYPGAALRTLSLTDTTRDSQAVQVPAVLPDPFATARLGQKSELYGAADTGASVLTLLPAGATVDVYAVQDSWAAVGSGGRFGFVETGALTAFRLNGADVTQAQDESMVTVSASGAQLLQLPVKGAHLIADLDKGESLQLIAYTRDWAMVTLDGDISGYTPRSALTLMPIGDAEADEIITPAAPVRATMAEDAPLFVNRDDTVSPKGQLTAGEPIEIIGYNSVWANVRTESGEAGFVKLSALSPEQARPEEAPEAAKPADEGGPVTKVKGEKYVYVTAKGAKLYESYSEDSPALAELSEGDRLRLGAYNKKWACVRLNDLQGFVLVAGVTMDAPAKSDAIEGGELKAVTGERYAIASRDGAPLYDQPDASAEPADLLADGDRVKVSAYNKKWARVTFEKREGYIAISDLQVIPENEGDETPAESQDIKALNCDAVTTGPAALFAASDLAGAPLLTLEAGARVYAYACNRTCAYVKVGNQKGFVALNLLRKAD